MKVLLVYPCYPVAAVTTFEEPIGVLYLAAALERAGHDVVVEDMTFRSDPACIDHRIKWAECVGISSSSLLFNSALAILKRVRQFAGLRPVVLGGPHATAEPAHVLAEGFDVAVIGEGETTIVDLVDAFSSGGDLATVQGIAYRQGEEFIRTPPRRFIPDLDEIPFPERRFIDYSRYRRIGLISMRGCPYQCIYCKPIEDVLFGHRLRCRSVENVIAELDEVFARYGNRQISFKDDTLTINRTNWFERLEEAFRAKGIRLTWQCSSRVDTIDRAKLKAMKRAGCRQIFFGIESGSQRILDYYKKGVTVSQTVEAFDLCREVGIRACASIMLGAPDETPAELEATYRLVKRLRPFNWHVHITTPICGSHLYRWARENKRLAKELEGAKPCPEAFSPTGNLYRQYLPMRLNHLSMKDIAACRDRINQFMKYRVLLKCLCSAAMWRELFSSRGMREIAANYMRRHFAGDGQVRRVCRRRGTDAMTLSIIIVSYNARLYLEACLKAIFTAHYPWEVEVIVVDNGSRDGSVELVGEQFPQAMLIETGINAGFARANNIGFAAASGEFLLMLNSDTETKGDALVRLVEFLKAHPDVGIATGRLVYPDLTDQGVARAFPTPINALFGRRSLLTKLCPNNRFARRYLLSRQHSSDSAFEADWVSGACLLFRRRILEGLGGLDEGFWMYWEDADFCYRAKQQAWRVFCVPAAVVVHHEGKSSGGRRDWRLIIEFNRSAYRYYRKHHLKSRLLPQRAFAVAFLALRTGALLCANAFRASGWQNKL